MHTRFNFLHYGISCNLILILHCFQDVYHTFTQVHTTQYRSSSPNLQTRPSELPTPSQKIHSFLKQLLKLNPILGHAVVDHLTDRRAKALKSPYNQGLQQVYIDCIYDAIADLNLPNLDEEAVKDAVGQIYKMLSLLDPPAEMTGLPLDVLFTDLINVMHAKPNTLSTHDIYSTLIGHSTTFLISEFCKCQEKLHRQKLNGLVGRHSAKLDAMSQDVRITLCLSEMKDREQAWREMFFQAISQAKHALENIVVSLV